MSWVCRHDMICAVPKLSGQMLTNLACSIEVFACRSKANHTPPDRYLSDLKSDVYCEDVQHRVPESGEYFAIAVVRQWLLQALLA